MTSRLSRNPLETKDALPPEVTTVTIGRTNYVNASNMNETLEADRTELRAALHLVEAWIDAIDTDPIPRGQATDNLLDLRILLPQETPLRLEVDRLLRLMPGQRMVDARWWADTTAHLHSMITPFSATNAQP